MVKRHIVSIITGPDGNIYLEASTDPLVGKGAVIKIQTHSKQCDYKIGDLIWTTNSQLEVEFFKNLYDKET